MKAFVTFITFLVLTLLVGFIGEMVKEDEVQELKLYCDMVQHHKWPDYKHIYVKECENVQSPPGGN